MWNGTAPRRNNNYKGYTLKIKKPFCLKSKYMVLMIKHKNIDQGKSNK